MTASFTPERVEDHRPVLGVVRSVAPSHAPPAEAAVMEAVLDEDAVAAAVITCPHCGGSGILRMGEQQFRTCLNCLGQGQLSQTIQQEMPFTAAVLRISAGRAG